MRKKAFSLIELMIVVSILGIMAAIVVPLFRDNIQKAKEAAAKDSLRILRTVIGAYAARNNGIPPGHLNNDPTKTPTGITFTFQLTPDYMKQLPENPFNGLSTVNAVLNGMPFPDEPDDNYGWLYQPPSKTLRLDTSGVDSEGVAYFDY